MVTLDPANPADPATWAVQQKQHLQAAWAATRSALAGAADKMMHQQKNTRAFAPMQGERVLLFYPRTALAAKGPPKLQQQWREAAILAQLGPATYLARVRFSRLPSTMVHINRLKPFYPRIILPKEQWCQDPPAATAAQQSALSASQTACPLECPCRRCPCRFLNRKRRRRCRRHKCLRKSRQQQNTTANSSDDQEFEDLVPQPEPASPTPTAADEEAQTPPPAPRPSTLQRTSTARSRFRRIFSRTPAASPTSPAEFFSCSDSDSDQPPGPATATPPAAEPGPSTRTRPLPPAPTTKRSAAPRTLQRLGTKLSQWTNFVPSDSSSSEPATPTAAQPPPPPSSSDPPPPPPSHALVVSCRPLDYRPGG